VVEGINSIIRLVRTRARRFSSKRTLTLNSTLLLANSVLIYPKETSKNQIYGSVSNCNITT
jgi:hypothetical protein